MGTASDRCQGIVPAVMALVMAVSLVPLSGIGRNGDLHLALVAMWWMVTGAVGSAVQASVMRMAGAEHRLTIGTLMPVAMNLGIAIGAAAGSGVIDQWSLALPAELASVSAMAAAVGFTVLARRTPRGLVAHVPYVVHRPRTVVREAAPCL